MQTVKAAALYFALVFGAGFILGPIRLLWVVPHFGTRTAELMETPIMLSVIYLAARWIVRRFDVPPIPSRRLGIGCLALGLVVVMELTVVLWLQGMTMGEFLATRDPVSGTVYLASLGFFAIMPLLVSRT